VDSIFGFGGHHVDTKVDTKNRVNATTESSLSDGADLGLHFALSQSKSFFPCLTPQCSRRLGTPLPSRLHHDAKRCDSGNTLKIARFEPTVLSTDWEISGDEAVRSMLYADQLDKQMINPSASAVQDRWLSVQELSDYPNSRSDSKTI
jgi:hypothetical protein